MAKTTLAKKERKPRTKIRKCDLVPNQNRLKALDSRQNQAEMRANLVKLAISSGPHNKNSKKITFDSDSDSNSNDQPDLNRQKKSESKQKLDLFDASSSEASVSENSEADASSSNSDSETEYLKKSVQQKSKVIKNFETLLKDDQEDDRFVSFGEAKPVTDSVKNEKSSMLKILADIQGKTEIFTKEQKGEMFSDPSKKRFDPTAKKSVTKNLAEKSKKSETESQAKKAKKVDLQDTTRHVTVTSGLKAAFAETVSSGGGFSFGGGGFSFGKTQKSEAQASSDSESETDQPRPAKKTKKVVKKKKFSMKGMGFSSDSDSSSSSSEEEKVAESDQNSEKSESSSSDSSENKNPVVAQVSSSQAKSQPKWDPQYADPLDDPNFDFGVNWVENVGEITDEMVEQEWIEQRDNLLNSCRKRINYLKKGKG